MQLAGARACAHLVSNILNMNEAKDIRITTIYQFYTLVHAATTVKTSKKYTVAHNWRGLLLSKQLRDRITAWKFPCSRQLHSLMAWLVRFHIPLAPLWLSRSYAKYGGGIPLYLMLAQPSTFTTSPPP